MNESRPPFTGSLRALGASAIAIFRTRLELLSIELAEEKSRVLTLAAWALSGLLALAIGVLMASLLVVAVFWDTEHRLTALGVVTAVYFAAGLIALAIARSKLQSAPLIFDETLAELERDRQVLGAAAEAPVSSNRRQG